MFKIVGLAEIMRFHSGFPPDNLGDNIFAMVLQLQFARQELAVAEFNNVR